MQAEAPSSIFLLPTTRRAPAPPAPSRDLRLDGRGRLLGLGRSRTFPFQQYVADDEHHTVYFDEGEGEALVFVHGLGANCTHWEPLLRGINGRYRLAGLDLVGCGWSDKPHVSYTVDVLRDHLLSFLDRQGIARATLVGHSMGGAVVLASALARPGLVDRLVLIDAAGVAPLPAWMRASSKVMLRRHLLLPLLGLGAGFILDNVFVDPPERNEHVRWFRDSSLKDELDLRHLRDFARVSETLCRDVASRDYASSFAHIHAPVLALWGDHDRLTTLSGVLDRLSGLRRLRTVVLKGCGHMPMVERPAETLFHLERFLSCPP